MSHELDTIQNEAVLGQFKVLHRHLPGESKGNEEDI
jgi:hypothetical protein